MSKKLFLLKTLTKYFRDQNINSKCRLMSTEYKSIASKINFEGRAFIDGKYVDAIDG